MALSWAQQDRIMLPEKTRDSSVAANLADKRVEKGHATCAKKYVSALEVLK
jgi:hypothetical protein